VEGAGGGEVTSRSRLLQPAILGGFDGTASLLGVIVYLLLTHPSLIFPAALSGAVSSALSMGAGEWLSDSENGFAASLVMGGATLAGALLPAIPFAFGSGPAAVAASAVLCAGIGYTVARLRTNRGLGLALAETFGLLAVILGITAALAVWLPSGGG
jgi:VIT1/CCC1 family predicted Fe2+/Mn2+ transporter